LIKITQYEIIFPIDSRHFALKNGNLRGIYITGGIEA